MMGIDVDRVIVFTFLIGSMLAGAAGVMFGLVFSQVYHLMGFFAGLKGFTAAVIGGIGSIPGAMLGGLLIGLAEAYTAGYWTSTFQDLVVFSLLIVVHAHAADRDPRPGRHPEGLGAGVPQVPIDEQRPSGEPRIGTDEWVAQHGERDARYAGRLGRARRELERLPWWALLLLVVAAGAPLPLLSDNDYVIRVGVDTLIYMLLALGLNVVVGWAGLLDLGYVAFFGFGAYLYAILSSDQFGLPLAGRRERAGDRALGGAARAAARVAVAAAARRLPRDRDPLLPADLRRHRLELEPPDAADHRPLRRLHGRRQRDSGRRPVPAPRLRVREQHAVLPAGARDLRARPRRRCTSSTTHARDARGGRCGRIRSRPS